VLVGLGAPLIGFGSFDLLTIGYIKQLRVGCKVIDRLQLDAGGALFLAALHLTISKY